MRVLSSEMIDGCLIIFALMILIAVSRRPTIWRPLAIAAAAMPCALGLENKLHAILLIAALPLLILPFGGPASASTEFWSTRARPLLARLTMALGTGHRLTSTRTMIAH